MIHILNKIPHKVALACSGGVDSMAILDFLVKGKKEVSLLYFNHGTQHSKDTESFIVSQANNYKVPLHIGSITKNKPANESMEEFWRNERYSFLHSFPLPVITCHHLNDCVEQWVFSSLHGKPNVIPYKNQNVIRPFLLTEKDDLISWCVRKGIPWKDDKSNTDTKYMRNHIRHNILPLAYKVNPGLNKVVKKKVLENNH